METGDILGYVFAALWLVVLPLLRLLRDRKRKQAEQAKAAAVVPSVEETPFPEPVPAPAVALPPLTVPPIRPLGEPPGWIAKSIEDVEQLKARAQALADQARHERATHRFVEPLESFVISNSVELLRELSRADVSWEEAQPRILGLRLVVAQIERFIEQRRNPRLLPLVGDADALAEACYQPIFEFARARSLKLASHVPVTDYGPYDLATWVGFIPTGLAPLSLPRDFFSRIAWWPALAHEIAHDFLAATEGLDNGLRQHLGLPSESLGRLPLRIGAQGLTWQEAYRIFGGWFEELFCDVFGTLMVGPAYAWAMVELFPSPADPEAIIQVDYDRTGMAYDPHPPRHLRLLVSTRVLELAGHPEDAEAIRGEWERLHQGWPEVLIVPVGPDWVMVSIDPFVELANQIADRLYGDPMDVFAGHRLQDIPGVDFGPHARAEAKRVARELLAGRVPHKTDARWVVSGATEAWREAPAQEREIIRLAREGISAVGTFDHAPIPAGRIELKGGIDEAREAFILHTIFSPPRGLRRVRGAARGFLDRPGA